MLERFEDRADEVRDLGVDDWWAEREMGLPSPEWAALKRASMDLTRALADLRRRGR